MYTHTHAHTGQTSTALQNSLQRCGLPFPLSLPPLITHFTKKKSVLEIVLSLCDVTKGSHDTSRVHENSSRVFVSCRLGNTGLIFLFSDSRSSLGESRGLCSFHVLTLCRGRNKLKSYQEAMTKQSAGGRKQQARKIIFLKSLQCFGVINCLKRFCLQSQKKKEE